MGCTLPAFVAIETPGDDCKRPPQERLCFAFTCRDHQPELSFTRCGRDATEVPRQLDGARRNRDCAHYADCDATLSGRHDVARWTCPDPCPEYTVTEILVPASSLVRGMRGATT